MQGSSRASRLHLAVQNWNPIPETFSCVTMETSYTLLRTSQIAQLLISILRRIIKMLY
jgi:hypothetical protein